MNVDAKMLWDAVIVVLIGPLAFWLKRVITRVDELEKQLAETREDYVTKEDMRHSEDVILRRFDKLDGKLDRLMERIPVERKS